MRLAPIVLFVYNRLDHTKKTIEALQKNNFASESKLYIYSDAPKNENGLKQVLEVREYIKNIRGFKEVDIIERNENWGLAASIIDGVTNIVNKYGKVIVLEDDIVTSPYFLKFVNKALNYYQDHKKVWHISGWNYPIITNDLEDVFLWRLMNCWGWATWSDRWRSYEKNIDNAINSFNSEDIRKFNLDGNENFWRQVLDNKTGRINTWAIFWYSTIFKNDGLCLNPAQTYVENIGHDGSGEHCGNNTAYRSQLSINENPIFIDNILENKIALTRIKKFYKKQKKSFIVRVINKFSRLMLEKNVIK